MRRNSRKKCFLHHYRHHQFLLSLSGHRPSTQHRHLVLFPAILLTSLQLFPFCNASLWTILRHVCLGRPFLLFPFPCVRGRACRPARPRTRHNYHHDTKVKPEAATAVIELLMMGGKMPETC